MSLSFSPDLTQYFHDHAENPSLAELGLETFLSFYAFLQAPGLVTQPTMVNIEGEYATCSITFYETDVVISPKVYLKPFNREITLIEEFIHQMMSELKTIAREYDQNGKYNSEDFIVFLVIALTINHLTAQKAFSQEYEQMEKFNLVSQQWMTVDDSGIDDLISLIKKDVLGYAPGKSDITKEMERANMIVQQRSDLILAFAKASLASEHGWKHDNPALPGVFYALEDSSISDEYVAVSVSSSLMQARQVCQLPANIIGTKSTIENYLTNSGITEIQKLNNGIIGLAKRGSFTTQDVLSFAEQLVTHLQKFLNIGYFTTLDDNTLNELRELHDQYTALPVLRQYATPENMLGPMIEMKQKIDTITKQTPPIIETVESSDQHV